MTEMQAPNCEPATVLVVDDDEAVLLTLRTVLEHMGHRVCEAGTMISAREALALESVEVVLIDINLGKGSGIDLLREIVPRSPEVAGIMMTGGLDPQQAIECLREGAFDYLLKPFTLDAFQGVVTRVLRRKREIVAERTRREEEIKMLGRFSAENPNPVLRVGKDGAILYANQASRALLATFNGQVANPLPPFLRQLLTDESDEPGPRTIEVGADGRVFSFTLTPIKDADYLFLYGHDITTLKQTQQELIRVRDAAQQMALHDALTGLPNRVLLDDRLQQAMVRCQRQGKKLATVFIDLDYFKLVNDAHGYQVGDQVLVDFARHLEQAVRGTDTVARWGGDEMVVLLSDLADLPEGRRACTRIQAAVQERLAANALASLITMSMGAAFYPDDAESADLLLQQAGTALRLAKTRGRNQVIFFGESGEMDTFLHQAHRLKLSGLLRAAVQGNNIQAHFQPIVATSTRDPVAVEALARWFEPDLGWIAPAIFIPMAEEMGLIIDLGWQVLEQALLMLKRWRTLGFPLTLHVNLSLRQVSQTEFGERLVELVRRHGLQPGEITIEITESQSQANPLQKLSEHGFRLSIDDFGQGYSSLSRLYEMPFQELKIDMKFARNLHTEKGRRVVQAIVEMAKALGLETVAEGVEDEEVATTLRALGVDRLQGFFFARPMPGADVEHWLLGQPAGLRATDVCTPSKDSCEVQ